MRTTEPTVAEFSGSAVKYYAAVVEYNKYLEKENDILKLESTDPHTVKNLAKKLAGKEHDLVVYKKIIDEEVAPLTEFISEHAATMLAGWGRSSPLVAIKYIKHLEAKNKTLRESTIDECIAIAKEAFNHQWPIRSCVDKFITLKALNQEKDG